MATRKRKRAESEEKREYFIVDRRILPTSIQNVIKVNDLIQQEKISKYEAIKRVATEISCQSDRGERNTDRP